MSLQAEVKAFEAAWQLVVETTAENAGRNRLAREAFGIAWRAGRQYERDTKCMSKQLPEEES